MVVGEGKTVPRGVLCAFFLSGPRVAQIKRNVPVCMLLRGEYVWVSASVLKGCGRYLHHALLHKSRVLPSACEVVYCTRLNLADYYSMREICASSM